MTRLAVSILTTSYNHRSWLEDTLDSVSCQTYPDLEHIVVDDGSTDDSVAILARYPPRAGLRYVCQENRGQAAALNRAFGMSSGDVIGWLSSDDVYYSPTVVSDVVAAFDADPTVVAVYGHAVTIDAKGLPLILRWAPPPWRFFFDIAAFSFAQPTLFVRRSAVGRGFVDEGLDVAMDAELLLRLRSIGRLKRLPTILAAERHHGSRKSYLLGALAEREHAILGSRGLEGRHDALWIARARLSWAMYRLFGSTLAARATGTPPAFGRARTSLGQLVRRQLFVRRSGLP